MKDSHQGPKSVIVKYFLINNQQQIGEKFFEEPNEFSVENCSQDLIDRGYEIVKSGFSTGEGTIDNSLYSFYVRETESLVLPETPHNKGDIVSFSSQLTWPSGISATDLNKEVRRFVSFVYENGEKALEPISQTLHFQRSALVNHAKNTVHYMPWNISEAQASFPEVTVPQLDGYHTDIQRIEAEKVEEVLDNSQDIFHTITFKKDDRIATIQIFDLHRNEIVHIEEVSGKTNDLIQYPIDQLLDVYIGKGYEIVSNDYRADSKFNSEEVSNVFKVTIRPREIEIDPVNTLPEAGKPVYPDLQNSIVWPEGLDRYLLERSVKRTIQFQFEDGTKAKEQIVQEIIFKRTAIVNLNTGAIFYTSWTSNMEHFPAYIPTSMEGFSAKPRLLAELTEITKDTADIIEVITYTKDIQKALLTFVDISKANVVLYKTQLIGRTGESYRYNAQTKLREFIANGYEVVDNNFPEKGTFKNLSGDIEQYTISLQPRILSVQGNSPKEAGSPVDMDVTTSVRWPAGVDKRSLQRTVARRVFYKFLDDRCAFESIEDTVEFRRDAVVNLVTAQVEYSEWVQQTERLQARPVPFLEGYTTDVVEIPAIDNLTVDSANIDVVVRYFPVVQPITIRFVDQKTNSIIAEQSRYVLNESEIATEVEKSLIPFKEQGYQVVSSGDNKFNQSGQLVVVSLEEVVVEVPATAPRVAHTPIEGYDRLTWPRGIEEIDLAKQVSRTIYYRSESGVELKPPTKQVVKLVRTANVTLATGMVLYTEWVPETKYFDAVETPVFEGYQSNCTQIAQQQVAISNGDQVIEATYFKVAKQAVITYVDSTNNGIVYKDIVTARDGQHISYHIEERLVLDVLRGYRVSKTDCPTVLDFAESDLEYTVELQPERFEITISNPRLPDSTTEVEGYGLFTWPAGLDATSLTCTIEREIRFTSDEGENLLQPVIQENHCTRKAFVNAVTKEVTYSDWRVEMLEFPTVEIPKIKGYTASQASISSIPVVCSGVDQTFVEHIVYIKNPYQFKVSVKDDETRTILETLNFTIRYGEAPKYSLDKLVEIYKEKGYELIETVLPEQAVSSDEEYHITLWIRPRVLKVSIEQVNNQFANFETEDAIYLKKLGGLTAHNLLKRIKRTIRYKLVSGEEVAPNFEDFVQFTRHAFVNLVTGVVTYSEWHSNYPIFDEVLSPIVAGYSADQEISPSIQVPDSSFANIVETVTYAANIQEVLVNIVNKSTGDILYTESIPDLRSFSHGKLELQDDSMLKNSSLSDTVESKVIRIDHKNSDLMRLYGLEEGDLKTTLSRTVEYIFGNGSEASPSKKQTLSYTREAFFNQITDNLEFSPWKAVSGEVFEAVHSPNILGYQADREVVSQLIANPTSYKNSVEKVIYIKSSETTVIEERPKKKVKKRFPLNLFE